MSKMVSNQNRDYSQFAGRPDEFKRKKNLFDLSHDHKTTFSMGQLIPFLTLETLPGDDFRIDYELMCRFAPLYLPIMHRCDLSVHYFYVPWRILWDKWEEYITQKEDLLPPYYAEEILTAGFGLDGRSFPITNYMGFPSRTDIAEGSEPIYINAGPLAAYWKIYNEYYRNSQIQPEIEIPLNAGDNDYTGWTLYNNEAPLFVANRLWNRDYFTSAVPTPQVGAEILVPISDGNLASTLRELDYTTPAAGNLAVNVTGEFISSGAPGNPLGLDIQEVSASMRNFRLAARMLEFLERLMRTGQRYRDFLKGHFGVDPDPGTIDLPVYIGGSKGRIIISEVMSTAETEDVPVGAYAGQALAVESGKSQVKYFCKEHGFIIGIINIQPRSSYFQGLERMWTRGVGVPIEVSVPSPGSVYDYAFEQFAAIGDQAILQKELLYSHYTSVPANAARNEETFGYIPRFSEYRWHNDIVSAEMRTIWLSFHLSRLFTIDALEQLTEPVLNSEFVQCFPRIADIFQVGAAQQHEIYAHIFNNVQVWRSLPKFGIPTL